jgi:nickel-dependent lactate racemase
MKKVKLAYGKSHLEINVPDDAVIIEPTHLDQIENEKEAAIKAMRNPIGTKPLRELVKATDTVAIVISDITRPTPNHKIVPWLLEEMDFVPRENFVIINGLGSHRPNTREELIQMLGEEVVNTIKIVNPDVFDIEKLTYVGTNTYGSKVYFDTTYVECSFKIVTGFIEPHFFAGFSGGPKGIHPGIAGIDTILDFHNAYLIGHPKSDWGIIEGNPVQDSATQNCLMAKPDFMLNVTLNNNKEITNIFAGDVIEAHRAGCAFAKAHAMQPVDDYFDIVITTNSGYPLDQNLYQTVKGMSAAYQIVRQGGAIISASECCEGVPDHGNYKDILKARSTPQELLDMINEPGYRVFDQWEAQKQAIIMLKADCYLYSSMDDQTVKNAMLTPIKSVEETLNKLIEKYGPGARVAVMPVGPLTIAYVK